MKKLIITIIAIQTFLLLIFATITGTGLILKEVNTTTNKSIIKNFNNEFLKQKNLTT